MRTLRVHAHPTHVFHSHGYAQNNCFINYQAEVETDKQKPKRKHRKQAFHDTAFTSN